MAGDRGIELVETVVEHRDVLSRLEADGPLSSRELEAALEYSRATVNRRLADLRSEGIVEAQDGRYELTEFGTVVLAEATDAFRRLDVVDVLATSEVLERLAELPLEFELAWLADATVLEATPEDPYRMYDWYLERWEETESLRTVRKVGPVPPAIVEGIKPKLETEFDAEAVWAGEAAEHYAQSYPELADIRRGNPAVAMFATDEPIPIEFTVFDRSLVFISYDRNTGHPATIVETADPEAIEWGRRVYDHYRERAAPVDEAILH